VESCGLDSSCSEKGPVAGSFEHSNESLGSIKGREKIFSHLANEL
jgi:hypothetical protein